MKIAAAVATGLALYLAAGPIPAQSDDFVGNAKRGCFIDHPTGCYINTDAKSPVKSIYFFNDSRGRCGVHVRVCPEGKACRNRTVTLVDGNTGPSRDWVTSRQVGKVYVTESYSFSGGDLGGGIKAYMTMKSKYTNQKGQTHGSTSEFRASPDGC